MILNPDCIVKVSGEPGMERHHHLDPLPSCPSLVDTQVEEPLLEVLPDEASVQEG